MIKNIDWFKNEEDGQGMVEYGLIVGLVIVAVIGTLTLLGDTIHKQLYENTVSKISF